MTSASFERAVPALDARGLTYSYGAVPALHGLDLTVHAGELYGLLGPDGAGKTTAISSLSGLLRPSAGQVRVLGEDPLIGGAEVRQHLGLMCQEASLYGDLSVAENMRFFARLFGLERATYRDRAERLLAITRLGPFVDRRADALSGGMYKKLALACALLHRPQVLLMDEPTNGVDPVSRRELWELIYELVFDGMAVLVSTAYMDEAVRCHRVGLLHAGRMIADGKPGQLSRGLRYDVIEVTGGGEATQARLAAHPDVVTASPAGAHLRVLVAAGAIPALEGELRAAGATCRKVDPSFEEVFLARMSGAGEGP